MIEVLNLISALRRAKIQLSVENGELRYFGQDRVSVERYEPDIKRYQSDILSLLKNTRPPLQEVSLPKSNGFIQEAKPFQPSLMQKRLWFMARSAANPAAFNLPIALRIKGDFDTARFIAAFRNVVSRHVLLSAAFKENNGTLWIEPNPERQPQHEYVDLTDLPEEQRETRLKTIIAASCAAPFDYDLDVLVRASTIRCGQADHVIVMVFSHLVADARSLQLFARELEKAYAAPDPAMTAQTTPPVQYQAFVTWQERQEDIYAKRLARLGETFKGRLPVLDLLKDRPRPALLSLKGAAHPLMLEAELVDRLRRFARAQNSSLFAVLFSAFTLLLYRYSGQEDLIVGCPVLGRHTSEMQSVIGPCANIIVLRQLIALDESVADFLARTQDTIINALAHEVPFESLVRLLRPERVANQPAIFQAMFNLEGGMESTTGLQLPNATSQTLPIETGAANFDLHMSLFEEQDQVGGSLLYSSDLFDPETIEAMVADYLSLLKKLTQQEHGTLKSLLSPVISHKHSLSIATNIYAGPIAQNLERWLQRLHLPVNLHMLLPEPMPRLTQDSPLFRFGKERSMALVLLEPDALWIWLNGAENGLAPPSETHQSRTRDVVSFLHHRRTEGYDIHVVILPKAEPGPSTPEQDRGLDHFIANLNHGQARACLDLRSNSRFALAVEADTKRRAVEAVYSETAALAIATELARIASEPFLPLIKAIVVDCDYTLWDGACADQPVDTLHVAPGHQALHGFLLAQRAQGRLICLCSRNDTDNVLDVFAKRQDMTLNLNHVTAYRINHQPKSANLRSIAKELNIGLDAILFIDDSSIECAEVERICPEVWVARAPDSSDAFEDWLKDFWILPDSPVTEQGAARATLYQEQAQRRQSIRQNASLADILNDLGMMVTVGEHHGPWDRIAEMTQRTNQFNLAKRPMRPSDLAAKTAQEGWHSFAYSARDRFGNYGVIGTVILRVEGRVAIVEQFILSCRAFHRAIEFRMVQDSLDWAFGQSLDGLRLPYQPSQANMPAYAFLRNLGFDIKRDSPAECVLNKQDGASRIAHAKERVLQSPVAQAEPEAEETAEKGLSRKPAKNRNLLELMPALRDIDGLRDFLGIRPAPTPGLLTRDHQPLAAGLGRLIAAILRIERLEPAANLYAHGADSLSLLQVVSACRNEGLDLRLEDFIQHQTIAELVILLDSRGPLPETAVTRRGQDPEPFALLGADDQAKLSQRPDIADAYPLSGMQGGMVFHAERDPDAAVYLVIDSFLLRGRYDEASLCQAIQLVMDRHPALRSFFDLEHFDEPLQLVACQAKPELSFIDLRQHEPQEAEQIFADWLKQEQGNRFRHGQALMRYTLHRFTDERFQISLTHHHALLDGWSLNSLIRELIELYEILIHGAVPPRLHAPNPGYAAFIQAERQAVSSAKAIDFWQNALHHPEISRPNNRASLGPPKPMARFLPISVKTGMALRHAAKQAGLSLQALLLAAHLSVIGIWTGRRQVVSGVLTNGRLDEGEGSQTLGLFVNSLPLHIDLKGESWIEFARRASKLKQDMEPYRRFPLPDLQRLSGQSPAFEFLFTFTHFHVLEQVREEASLEVIDTYNYVRDTVPVHAFFDINPALPDEIRLLLNLDQSRIDQTEIEALSSLYMTALKALSENPSGQWLAGFEAWQALSAPARTTQNLVETHQPNLGVDALFSRHAADNPDRIALIEGERRLSYGMLEQRSDRLAAILQEKGLSAGTVAIACHSAIETLIALIAVAKSGAAWAVLDLTWPQERRDWIIANINAAAMIHDAQSGTEPDMPDGVVSLHVHTSLPGRKRPRRNPPAQRLAYIIHTSGSSGKPKAVLIGHTALAFLISAARHRFNPGHDGIWTLSHSFGFDFSVWEYWGALANGQTLLSVSAQKRSDPEEFQNLIRRERPSVIGLTASAIARLFPDQPTKSLLSKQAGVQALVCGGEALPANLAQNLLDCGVALWNFYGPTEACVWTSFDPVLNSSDCTLLGQPLAGAEIVACNDFFQPVRHNGTGTAHIAGPGLAWGYLHEPKLTAQAFKPYPYATQLGERLYDTGDLIETVEAGGQRFIGRRDFQIKLRGYRIEIGEIESVIDHQPGIHQSAVIACGQEEGRIDYLCCLFTGNPGMDIAALRANLRSILPDYMVPSRFILLESWPTNANGKLDRIALHKRAVQERSFDETAEQSTAMTPAEQLLADIWQAVLEAPKIDANADFFELGGDSIKAAQITARTRNLFGLEVPLRRILEKPRLRDYCAALGSENPASQQAWNALGEMELQSGPAPLSSGQRGLWFAHQLSPQPAAYNIPIVLKWVGPLDVEAMRESMRTCFLRHEVLRSHIVGDGSALQQIVLPPETIDIIRIDLSHHAGSNAQQMSLHQIEKMSTEPFDLTKGPLVRAAILSAGHDTHYLVSVIHHSVCDGWSVAVLRREIAQIYRNRLMADGQTKTLPHLQIQYADYARWQTNHAAALWHHQLPWWREKLKGGLPELGLYRPGLLPDADTASDQGSLSFTLGEVEALKAYARKEGCTLFVLLLAAFKANLSAESGQTDLWVGSAVSCRDHPVLEGLVGFLVNTIILRTQVAGCADFSSLLQRVKTTTLEAHERRHVPFEELVFDLKPARDKGNAALVHAIFELHNAPNPPVLMDGVTCDIVEVPSPGAKYALALLAQETPTALHCVLEYDPRLYSKARMQVFIDRFCSFITQILQSPNGILPLMSSQEEPKQGTTAPPIHWRQKFRTGTAGGASPRDSADIVVKGPLSPQDTMPLVFSAPQGQVEIEAWLAQNQNLVQDSLNQHGALLFRGFQVDNAAALERITPFLIKTVLHENGEHRPVSGTKGIQTPVRYAPENKLLWHNENTFNAEWPTRIIFACGQPAKTGGETPLVDARRLYQSLPATIRDAFTAHGVMYERSYSPMLGLPWQKVFMTEDPRAVETICANQGFDYEWCSDGSLRTRCVRPAAYRHPQTGEWCWSNQAQHWHIACLDPETRALFTETANGPSFPRNCYFGDGLPIPDAMMLEILACYARLEVSFPWQKGDFVVLDNLMIAHGRNAYSGPRTIYVAMGDCIRV